MHRDRRPDCRCWLRPHVRKMGEASKILRRGYAIAVLAVSAMLIAQAGLAASSKLPATAPIPTDAPANPPETGAAGPQSVPVPTSRPDLPAPADVAPPVSGPRARQSETFGPPAPPKGPPALQSQARPQPVDEQEERQCRADLRKLGVEFEPHEPLADLAAGCFVANPVTLKSLGKAISLSPEAILNCNMARATARFMQEVAAPIAKASFGADLTSIGNASAYVCRPRHGTTKLSEHGLGNAIDIASFTLADGRRIDVKAGADEKQAAFLDAIRKAACGPFTTVLGPGSDADHNLHFHFDMEKRRPGSTFCQ
jgi:hypothetical protein